MTDLDPTTTTPTTPYEPAPMSAPFEPVVPVAPPPTPNGRVARLRWAIALVVVAVVVSASLAAAALITGKSPNATVLGYVPDKTIVYGEVRLDLPGDQRKAVGEFLSHFPGFKDQAALDSKLDEVLDDLTKDASKGDMTYTTDIKPWFDGELAFSVGPLPDPKSLTGGQPSAKDFHVLALMSVKDAATAQAWFDKAIKQSGATTTTETYNGATLTVFGASGTDKPQAAFALLDGKVAVAGDISSVRDAVDTKGKSGFANEPDPKAALGSTNEDHVGFMYVALRPIIDWTQAAAAANATGSDAAGVTALSGSMTKYLPDWGAFWLRFENDAVVMDATAPKTDVVLGPTQDKTSTVANHIPGSALAVVISNDYGATLQKTLDAYKAEPALKDALTQLDKALGLVGGADAAIGWIGDTAIVVNAVDGTPEAGLVILPTDKTSAARLFTSLRNVVALGGAEAGVTIRDESYNGATITIVDLGDLSKLSGLTGMTGTSGLTLPSGHVELAYTVTDDLVVFGTGPAFVKHVLDTTSANSLASNDRYKQLMDRVGAKNTGSYFVDIAAIRGLVEGAVAKADKSVMTKYETDVKPYLTPFDALAAANSVGGDLSSSTLIITVK